MPTETFESVEFKPLQRVSLERPDPEDNTQYPTYVSRIHSSEMDLRVPQYHRLFVPIDEGDMVTFRCNRLSGTYECRIKIRDRHDGGDYPTLTIPRPAKMKRIQQREDVRVPCELDVTLWELEEGTESIDRGPLSCTAVDISAGGMKLHSGECLTERREIVMNFKLPLIDKAMETIFGRVLRVFDEKVGEQYVSAVKFSGLTDDQRDAVIRYAYRRQIKLKKQGLWVQE